MIRLTHIDGKLPNLALMKLAHYHRQNGDEIYFSKHVERELLENPDYEIVYGSAIFSYSRDRVALFKQQFPNAIVGGTYNLTETHTVEDVLGVEVSEACDYSIYPGFRDSIGFTQRGCRLKCGFCVVPKKEGKQRSVNTISSIWRGDPLPRHVHLLDNDFFGQPREQWEARVDEMLTGNFKVCLDQGINVRMITEESAKALASMPLFNDRFDSKRLFTAWDNIGDEQVFFRGVDLLERHGVNLKDVVVYMLMGYDRRETWERLLYRLHKMVERGLRPYPMIYGDRHRRVPLGGCNQRIEQRTLGDFHTYVIRRCYFKFPFEEFEHNKSRDHPIVQAQMALL